MVLSETPILQSFIAAGVRNRKKEAVRQLADSLFFTV
jgi:hypothetical protein